MANDPGHDLGFTAEQLGRYKANAQLTGQKLVAEFQDITRLIEQLKEQGISVTSIKFENAVVQAAWVAFQRPDDGPPRMAHEDELIEEFVARS